MNLKSQIEDGASHLTGASIHSQSRKSKNTAISSVAKSILGSQKSQRSRYSRQLEPSVHSSKGHYSSQIVEAEDDTAQIVDAGADIAKQ